MTQYTIEKLDTFHAEISFDGIAYEAFDRTGHWSLWGIVKMFEASRLLCLYNDIFDFKSVDNKAKGLVVIKQTMKLSPEVHRGYSIFNTLRQLYVLDIADVGRTSFSFVTNLYNKTTHVHLGHLLLKYVLIDRTTRKPTPLPESFIEKYKKLTLSKRPPPNMQIGDTPDPGKRRLFQIKAFPLHSDTDRNNHVNQSVYIRYCLDCATEAALSGVYRHFTSDMCWFPVEEVGVYHVNESLVNQELIVSTWQDEDDFRLIHFLIHRNEKLLLKASFLFNQEKSKRRSNSRM